MQGQIGRKTHCCYDKSDFVGLDNDSAKHKGQIKKYPKQNDLEEKTISSGQPLRQRKPAPNHQLQNKGNILIHPDRHRLFREMHLTDYMHVWPSFKT